MRQGRNFGRAACYRGRQVACFTFGLIPNMADVLNIHEGTLKLNKLVGPCATAVEKPVCVYLLMQARRSAHPQELNGVVLDATQTVVAQAHREDERSQRHTTQRATHHLRTSARLLCDHRAFRQRRVLLSAQPLNGELR